MAPGGEVAPNYHIAHEERVTVYRGEGTLKLGEDLKAQELRSGDSATIPRGAIHAFEPRGGPVVAVVVFTPPFDGKDRYPVVIDSPGDGPQASGAAPGGGEPELNRLLREKHGDGANGSLLKDFARVSDVPTGVRVLTIRVTTDRPWALVQVTFGRVPDGWLIVPVVEAPAGKLPATDATDLRDVLRRSAQGSADLASAMPSVRGLYDNAVKVELDLHLASGEAHARFVKGESGWQYAAE
jgi:hypothetical protein